MTQHDRLCAGLEALGAVKMPKRNKYTMYLFEDVYWFVGRAGALRVCNRPNAAMSTPALMRRRQRVLDAPLNKLGIEL